VTKEDASIDNVVGTGDARKVLEAVAFNLSGVKKKVEATSAGKDDTVENPNRSGERTWTGQGKKTNHQLRSPGFNMK